MSEWPSASEQNITMSYTVVGVRGKIEHHNM